jgi:hypothetical protein
VSSRDEGARDERAQAEEQAWREIVDHYGERPALPDEPEDLSVDDLETADPADHLTDDGVVDRPVDRPGEGPDHQPSDRHEDRPDPAPFVPYSDHFVPPPLPPPPDISPDRRFAWIGLIAPPLVLLLVVVLRYPLPGILTGALVVAFLGSFGYLVATMSREPRDPEDDGARL